MNIVFVLDVSRASVEPTMLSPQTCCEKSTAITQALSGKTTDLTSLYSELFCIPFHLE